MEKLVVNQGVKLTSVALPLLLVSQHYTRKGTWIFKPLASVGFLISALSHRSSSSSLYGTSVMTGLVCGALGDVLLIPKAGFLAGLGSFLVGHVALVYAFTLHPMNIRHGARALVATTVIATLVGRWLFPHIHDKTMRRAVSIYMAIISCMVITASASVANAPLPQHQLAGALMFYLSDLFVAREEFVSRSKWNQWIGLPLYYGAQLLLAGTLQH
ncbi:uncharacterized protein BX664DRAFT_333432 [Halteromyces radiatus]|uniref:uncharacterized protein n=1 Tax=Halteromyces radiatus TaxID=101107 RepID=UPI00221FCC2B|nr:uncharacterized protein BX664DRAFT_333432 [Halteromyces radiatus]KAI8089599.1 putative membrane protein [Halteromyces radiatus]